MTTNVRHLSRPRAALSAISSGTFIAFGFDHFPRLLKFGTVGSSGVLVNSLALLILHDVAGLPLLIAAPLAFETSIFNNFTWNNLWTFGRRRTSLLRAFLKYNASCLVGLVICMITLQLLVHATGIHYLAANLVGIGLATTSNFLLSNLWAWHEEPSEATVPTSHP